MILKNELLATGQNKKKQHAINHQKFLKLCPGYYHITGQVSKNDTALIQPCLPTVGRGDVEVTVLMCRITTILTLIGSGFQLVSSWQTKIKQAVTQYRPCTITKTRNKPIYIYIYTLICPFLGLQPITV